MTNDKKDYKKIGVIKMATMLKNDYKYNLEEAINEGIKEMRLIKSGKLPKKSWQELKSELQKDK